MKLRAAIRHFLQGKLDWPGRLVLALILTLMVAINVCPAQVAVPELKARVTDLTGTLTAEQRAALETRLQTFETAKGSQIAVLLVPTTAPEEIEQYAIRVVEAWKLGREAPDDGALLLVAKNDRAVRIEVGRGLEGALNDATANRITDDIIVPQFRAGDFYGGISAGVDSMIKVIEGEPLPPPQPRQARGRSNGAGLESVFVIALVGATVAGAFLRRLLGRLPGAAATGAGVGFLAWLIAGGVLIAIVGAAIAFFATLAGGSRRGLTSGALPGVWGGGGFGGGRGEGFGGGFGGGGGSFGGGGATGRW